MAGAFLGGIAAAAGGTTIVAEGKLSTGDDATPPPSIVITVIIALTLRAAPCMRVVFPEYSHIEGRNTIVP